MLILHHVHMFLRYTVRRIHPWPTKATKQPSRETWSTTLHRPWDHKGHRHTASYHTWRHKKLTMSCSGTHRSNCDPLINSMVITQLICWHMPGIHSVTETINLTNRTCSIRSLQSAFPVTIMLLNNNNNNNNNQQFCYSFVKLLIILS